MSSERAAADLSITCNHVGHRYGSRSALADISFTTGPGLTAILGRNGAGKTTLLRAITTLLAPREGAITVFGHDTRRDVRWIRRRLGYLPQEFAPFAELTAGEFLAYVATLAGLKPRDAVQRAAELTNLTAQLHTRTDRLSGGTRRRLGVAQALLGEPPLLVVDEPTTGLDPEERVRLRRLLAVLATRSTILLSTHLVEDVAALVDRVIVLHDGHLRFDGRTSELIARARGLVHEIVWESPTYQDPRLVVTRVTPETNSFRLRLVGPTGRGDPVEPTLEDGYLALVSGETLDR